MYIIVQEKLTGGAVTKKILNTFQNYISATNKSLWVVCICISVFSVLLISSMQRSSNSDYAKTQLMAIILGYIGAIIISIIDYRFFIKHWIFSSVIGLSLLLSVFIFGMQVDGTDDTAWIQIGSITFQPSELVKIIFVITFAKHLTYLSESEKLKKFSSVAGLLLHAGIPMTIIHLQGDDGAVLIFFMEFLFMCFVAGVPIRYFSILFGGIIVGIPLIWTFFFNDEHRNRILALFDLDGNSMTDYAWQQYQGKVSIASGKLSGYGLGKGPRVDYSIVPEQQNDFIFTVAGEELGFIGCVMILLLLFLLCLCIFITAKKSNDLCGRLICYGVFAIISSQSIINIGMVLGLIPVIGITLPFFSAGGTSAMCLYLAVGLVQSVHTHNEFPDLVRIPFGQENRRKI